MISLTDRWAPPVAHCNDLSPPKLWPLVACVHGRIGKWSNVMRFLIYLKITLIWGTIMLMIRELFPYIIWKVCEIWVNSSIIYCFILKWDCEGGVEVHPSCTQTGGVTNWTSHQLISDDSVMIHSNKWIISELSHLVKASYNIWPIFVFYSVPVIGQLTLWPLFISSSATSWRTPSSRWTNHCAAEHTETFMLVIYCT